VDQIKAAQVMGIHTESVSIDPTALGQWKPSILEHLSNGLAQLAQ
jgi:hypothetical protein